MSEIPRGWVETTLGELGRYLNGRGFKKSEWAKAGRPIIRIQNLTGSGSSYNYFAGKADERHVVRRGDLLVSWAATLGVYEWDGPEAVLNQHIFKVESFIDRRFHKYLIERTLTQLLGQAHGTGMVHITRKPFDETPVLLPPRSEQRRIVEAIEEQFSRLDAAQETLRRSLLSVDRLRTVLLRAAVSGRLRGGPIACARGESDLPNLPATWQWITVADAGESLLGRQRSPRFHHGPTMRPYLRVANVFEDRIDTSDLYEMHFSDEAFERYQLEPGDVLLNEGQSPEWLGRPAIYKGELPDACFTNTLIRFRARPGVDPRFALLVFRSHMRAGRFARESRITTNIAHLTVSRFRTVEFPLPPPKEQERIVALADQQLSVIDALEAAIIRATSRGKAVRTTLLREAFAGGLSRRGDK